MPWFQNLEKEEGRGMGAGGALPVVLTVVGWFSETWEREEKDREGDRTGGLLSPPRGRHGRRGCLFPEASSTSGVLSPAQLPILLLLPP